MNARGVAMTFLAQIDCSNLPPLHGWDDPRPWRHDGRLVRIFADLVDTPNEPGLAIALACDPETALSRTEAPPIPDPFPPGGQWDDLDPDERFHVLPEAAIGLVPFLTAPEIDPELKPEIFDFSDPAEAFSSWGSELRGGGSSGDRPAPWELHHLLGEPVSIQDDVLLTGPAIYSDDRGHAGHAG